MFSKLIQQSRGNPAETTPVTIVVIGTMMDEVIAVIGMSARMPSANSIEEYWEILSRGIDAIIPMPKDRDTIHRNTTEEVRPLEAGFFKCRVDEFDAKFFGISPREAVFMDPQQRLLLEIAWESLEESEINPLSLKGSNTGVYVGIWKNDYSGLMPVVPMEDFHHRYIGNAFSTTTARISYFLGLHGPNVAFESGCSSALAAFHLACEALRHGDIPLALAGGVNLILDKIAPLAIVMSPDQRCKTFDESANGFVRAEACAMLVLKRYADAVKDGDSVHAIIRGSAMNNDGAGSSFGTPNAVGQEAVIRSALKNANFKPGEVSLIEAHGTGTAVGDPTEVGALGRVYSEGRTMPIWLGSVKSNIGHTEAASGIAGLLKVILCFKNNALPPQLHLKELNKKINLEQIPAIIPTELTKWEGEDRIAAVSSFGFSGTNVHVLVQQPPKLAFLNPELSESQQVLVMSAKSQAALDAMRKSYVVWGENNLDINIEDLAYGMNTKKAAFSYRLGLTASNVAEFASKLEQGEFQTSSPRAKPRIAFLFTGQGSQYVGMAKNLYKTSAVFAASLDSCDSSYTKALGISLFEVLWGSSNLLSNTLYCQPAIFCVEVALVELWKSIGIFPSVVVGHSVGEFAAAFASGLLSFEGAFTLVTGRSRLVSQLPSGAMLVVKAEQHIVRELIRNFETQHPGKFIDIAAINSANEIVLSGEESNVVLFEQFAKGIRTSRISTSHAFHSRQMESCLEEFGEIAKTIEIQIPTPTTQVTYISGTTAKRMSQEDFSAHYWQEHLRQSVNFEAALATLAEENCNIFLEIGSQPILIALAMGKFSNENMIYLPSMRKAEENFATFCKSLTKLYVAGCDLDWENWFGNRKRKVGLPFYPFQRSRFWFQQDLGGNDGGGFNLNTRLVNPFLGRHLPLPIPDTIYTSKLRVGDSLSYLQDHKVGEQVILPGVVYLEIIMAAAEELGLGHDTPLTVENLSIEKALPLESTATIYTVISKSEDSNYEVKVHHEVPAGDEQEIGWKLVAKGRFGRSGSDVPQVRLNLNKTTMGFDKPTNLALAYERIALTGMQLGPQFSNIKKIWSGDSSLLAELTLPEGSSDYVCHPILLDAMIQSYVLRDLLSPTDETPMKKVLHLPIGIRKFSWYHQKMSPILYVHAIWGRGDDVNIDLYNAEGELVAKMENLELFETTLDAFIRQLNGPKKARLPQMWENIWKPSLKHNASRIDTSSLTLPVTSPNIYDFFSPEVSSAYRASLVGSSEIDGIFIYVLLRASQECNWGLELGATFNPSSIWLPPKIKCLPVWTTWVQLLCENGYLEPVSPGTEAESASTITRAIPSISECNDKIASIIAKVESVCGIHDALVLWVKRIEQNFTHVVKGNIEPLEFLVPNDENEFGLSRFYSEATMLQLNTKLLLKTVREMLDSIEVDSGPVRILEVGAGTGATTKDILNTLLNQNHQVEYHFTDISPYFVSAGKKQFGQTLNTQISMNYNVFNIEEDPLSQGFEPESYDIIFAANVVHATSHIGETLSNLRMLLRPGGVLVLVEMFKTDDIFNSFSFGLVEGWWNKRDFRTTALIDGETWKMCMSNSAFEDILVIDEMEGFCGVVLGRKPLHNLTTPTALVSTLLTENNPQKRVWLLLGDTSPLMESLGDKLNEYGRIWNPILDKETTAKEINSMEQFSKILTFFQNNSQFQLEGIIYFSFPHTTPRIESTGGPASESLVSGDFLEICKLYLTFSKQNTNLPRLFGITRGVHFDEDKSMGNPISAQIWGLLGTFGNENPDLPVAMIDLDPEEVPGNPNEVDRILQHLWSRTGEPYARFFDSKVHYSRMRLHAPFRPSPIPSSSRFKWVVPTSGSLDDIQFRSEPAGTPRPLAAHEVEVEIRAVALNFRDLYLVLRPDLFKSGDEETAGCDVSGVIVTIGSGVTEFQVGDEVFALHLQGGFKSHVIVGDDALFRKQSGSTFAGAATLPCAFFSAFASLVNIKKISSTDHVLIHVATGGVGLAAIQIAQEAGAEIYATAGSPRKRAYLRSIGIKHVYNSRNTDFGDEILRDAKGAGITIVVNSLTAPGFKETSLRICAQGAVFAELAKADIWTKAEVAEMRPDVTYEVVDIAACPILPTEVKKVIVSKFGNGDYKPLPHTIWPLTHLKQAFHYFKKAKHIGKVVIKMPRLTIGPQGPIWSHEVFSDQSTYVITGGLGGIGLEVANWMRNSGAQNIVLVGRSKPTIETQALLESWGGKGRTSMFSTLTSVTLVLWQVCWKVLRRACHHFAEYSTPLEY